MIFFNKLSLMRVALIIATINLSGCLSEETFTLRPIRTATILESNFKNFGICNAGVFTFVDRRPPSAFIEGAFIRERESSRFSEAAHLTGYEVLVQRGESCHLITANKFQTAVAFDLSSLPSTAVVAAELRINDSVYGGTDAPVGFGTREQCSVLVVGQATETWASGIFLRGGLPEERVGDGPRAFITWRPARPEPGPYYRIPPIDITTTVSEWARGTQPNHGFVITPDSDAVSRVAAGIREGGVMCPVWLDRFELVVTVAVSG
ncbi:hypothetical protein [Sulfuriflexus mobilis]|uniref:hypothetical protein n=1 Tax=Sulfuriflexus mobilis TaxID=1811807 RepID=UPI000F820958|nr:hypothetical protein [Sulfuriflexus mobilis]